MSLSMRTTSIKFIIIGDANTGKTTLAQYFANDHSFINAEATIGLDFVRKSIIDQRYGVINFILWDTGGAERYQHASITQTYYRGAEGVIIVFDLTSRESFTSVQEKWLPRLRTAFSTTGRDHRCILVGNKSDLSSIREVGVNEAIDVANKHGMNYVELSSLMSECSLIRLPFLIVAKQLIDDGICRPMDDSLSPRKGIRLSSSSTHDRKGGSIDNVNNDKNGNTCCNSS